MEQSMQSVKCECRRGSGMESTSGSMKPMKRLSSREILLGRQLAFTPPQSFILAYLPEYIRW